MIKLPKLSLSNLGTGMMFVFLILLIFSPDTKAFFIEGLMKVGLFQPNDNTDSKLVKTTDNFSGVQFKDGSGKIVQLAQFKGKVIFINFWATWCPPCRAEMPSLQNLYLKFKDNKNIVVLMVDMDDNYLKAKEFMDRKKFSLPVFTPASSIPESLFSGSLPTTVVLNKKGQIIFRHEGAGDFSNKKFNEFLTNLSNE